MIAGERAIRHDCNATERRCQDNPHRNGHSKPAKVEPHAGQRPDVHGYAERAFEEFRASVDGT